MSLGRIIARALLKDGKNTTWFPSYGAEVRGGTAYSFVRASDTFIASPLIEKPNIAVILNQISLDKFEKGVKEGGLLIYNSDSIQREPLCENVEKIKLALNIAACECGSIKVANTVALGALTTLRPHVLKREIVMEVLKDTFRRQEILAQNLKAFCQGERLVSC